MKRLYIGNVPYHLCTDEGLRELFDDYPVESTHIVNGEDGRPRGFCFVEMSDAASANRAIELLNGVRFHGRNVTVRLAHDKRANGGEHRPRERNERRARY